MSFLNFTYPIRLTAIMLCVLTQTPLLKPLKAFSQEAEKIQHDPKPKWILFAGGAAVLILSSGLLIYFKGKSEKSLNFKKSAINIPSEVIKNMRRDFQEATTAANELSAETGGTGNIRKPPIGLSPPPPPPSSPPPLVPLLPPMEESDFTPFFFSGFFGIFQF